VAAEMVAADRQATRHVVLVGAGHAHVEVLRSFAASAPAGVSLTLITRTRHTPYSGMLPGLIAGLYRFEETHIDTQPLASAAGANYVHAEVVGLDLSSRLVLCRDAAPVAYDILSFDIGSTPNTEGSPGASAHAIPVKPIDGFLSRFDSLIDRVRGRGRTSRIVVVGGGAAGVELMLSIERRLRAAMIQAGLGAEILDFTLVSASADILPSFPDRFRSKFRRLLQRRGIRLMLNTPVMEVAPREICIEGHPALVADEVLWVTQAAAPRWLEATGLPLSRHGFIEVDDTLRVPGEQDIFAVGDVAAFLPRSLPKSGVYAVRQGPVLADNIRRLATGERLRGYAPQRETLYLVSTGERHAIGTRNGFVVEGDWVWRFKDWLDRRWMRRYQTINRRESPHR
jgi:selenide, water dikinase